MKYLSMLLLFFLCLFSLSAEDLIDDYKRGQASYRADENIEAIKSFEQFRADYPSESRADDALWYLGRLYRRLGQIEQAEKAFRAVLSEEGSNRRTEAFYDLVKLLDRLDREEEVITLIPLVFPEFADDKYAVKSLPTIFKSYSIIGNRYRRSGLGGYAESLWTEVLLLVSIYDTIELESEEAEKLLREKIKFLSKISTVTLRNEDFSRYAMRADSALAEYISYYPDSDYVDSLQSTVASLYIPYSDLDLSTSVAGVYNAMTNESGFFGEFEIGGDIEPRRNLRLGWQLDYKHDTFDFKTFNFSDLKTGNERFFGITDEFSGEVSLSIGSRYLFLNKLSLDAGVNLAEDLGDFNYGMGFAWDVTKSLGKSSIFNLDNSFSADFYPDYLNAGREISNIKFSTSPGYTFVIAPGWNLGLEYGFDYKYYLNAHYDTVDKGIDPDTRRYFTHDGTIAFKSSPLKWLDVGLKYNFTYLDSVNYDLWLYGSPQNLFVEDFYDYYKQIVKLDLDINAAFYSADLSAAYSFRQFVNYPARNAEKIFTGEKRTDSELFISLENRFDIFKPAAAGTFSIMLDGMLNTQISNHTYEVSYLTNYLNTMVSLGIEWKY